MIFLTTVAPPSSVVFSTAYNVALCFPNILFVIHVSLLSVTDSPFWCSEWVQGWSVPHLVEAQEYMRVFGWCVGDAVCSVTVVQNFPDPDCSSLLIPVHNATSCRQELLLSGRRTLHWRSISESVKQFSLSEVKFYDLLIKYLAVLVLLGTISLIIQSYKTKRCRSIGAGQKYKEHALNRRLTYFTHSLTHSLNHSLNHSLTHSLNHSLIHSLTHSLTHSLIHSFIHSFIHSPFIHSSFILHSFIHSFLIN
jgi:hypothetical protein